MFVSLLAACQSLSHWSDFESEVNFGAYKTYSINDQCSDYNPEVNLLNQQRIKNAIEMELRGIGYKRSDDPDLLVKFLVKNETEYLHEHCLNEYDGYRGGSVCIDRVTGYKVGTLVIDLIDVRQNMVVWQGGGQGDSWLHIDPKKIKKMVSIIMADYSKLREQPEFTMLN